MVRGFVELARTDSESAGYMEEIRAALDRAWHTLRDEEGLFAENFDRTKLRERKSLLTQGAMAEMYARTAERSYGH